MKYDDGAVSVNGYFLLNKEHILAVRLMRSFNVIVSQDSGIWLQFAGALATYFVFIYQTRDSLVNQQGLAHKLDIEALRNAIQKNLSDIMAALNNEPAADSQKKVCDL